MAKELTDKEKIFLEVLLEQTALGVSLDAAMWVARDKAGYAESTHPKQVYIQLEEEIISRITTELAMKMPEVIQKVDSVLKDPTQLGAKTVLDAATWMADRAGLVKKDQSTVTVKTEQGIIVMPPKKKEE